jgi:hypothetical protein
MVAWSKSALLAELRRRAQRRQQLRRGLSEGLRRQLGSLSEARARAGLPDRRRAARSRAAARSQAAAMSGATATSGRGLTGRGSSTAMGRTTTATGRGTKAWRRWPRERVIEKLRAWSASGGQLRQDVFQACKDHFGSLERACAEAGVPMHAIAWTPDRIRRALRDPRFNVVDPSFVAACVYHFGSVTAARAAATRTTQRVWSKATVIAELLARARRGFKGVGRLLREPAVRLFGSTDAALQAAARSGSAGRHGASSRREV